PHPLYRAVVALSHRQRLVRRLPAGDRLRDRGGNRQHLLGALVSDHRRLHELRRGAPLPARDEGPRHHPHLTPTGPAGTVRRPFPTATPRSAGRFLPFASPRRASHIASVASARSSCARGSTAAGPSSAIMLSICAITSRENEPTSM